jgi:hypothetical protein
MDVPVDARLRRLEDIEALRALMARYHVLCDGGHGRGTHPDPDAIAELFTEDGEWDETTRQPAPKGRAEIAAMARELQAVAWIVHSAVNPLIVVEGDTATGEFKGVLRVKLGESSPVVGVVGIYRMVAARTPDGWRFRSLAWEPVTHGRYDPGR